MRYTAVLTLFASLLTVTSARRPFGSTPARLDSRSTTTNDTLKRQLIANVGTCVRLRATAHIGATRGHSNAGVALDSNTCLCVDAEASAGLGGVNAGAVVVASNGDTFTGNVAAEIISEVRRLAMLLRAEADFIPLD